jgi:hypothetical protein
VNTTFPEYMSIRKRHEGFGDTILQFEALIPHDKGVEFWKWCQGQEKVSIKLDMMSEFHCLSCLKRTEQQPWSPRTSPAKNTFQVIVRCFHCGSFYMVVWTTTKKAAQGLNKRRKSRG